MLLSLIVIPLPWGSNSDIMMAAYSAVFSLLLVSWILLLIFKRIKLRSSWSAFAWISLLIWILWLCWISIQLLEFHPDLLSIWSPAAAEIHAAGAAMPGYAPYSSISIDRSATASQLILSGGYFSLYVLILLTANSRERIRQMLWMLLLSGLAQAFYGMHMTLSGMEYGFLEKKIHNLGVATGTFVNRNHYAAYLVLTLAAGIGLVAADLGRLQKQSFLSILSGLINTLFSDKFRARIMLVVIVAALILTRSRMGSVAFFASLCACGMLFTLMRHRQWLAPSMLLFGSLLIVDLWIVSEWFGLDAVVTRLENTELASEGRALVLDDLRHVIRDYQITGAGLGNFAAAYSPYTDDSIAGYFDHAHNEYAEFLIETGLVGLSLLGLLMLVHILHCVRVIAQRQTAIYAAGAFASLMAMTAMMVHSLAEFMLRIPAVAATLVALMALGMSISSESRAPRSGAHTAESNASDQSAA